VTSFYTGLAGMLRAGLPVREAIASLRQTGSLHGPGGAAVDASIQGGSKLSDALRRAPDLFLPEEIALVAAGEETGRLDAILDRLAELREEVRQARSRFLTQIGYPLLIFHVAALAMPIGLVTLLTGKLNFTLTSTITILILGAFWGAVIAAAIVMRTNAGREKVRRIGEVIPGLGAALRHRRFALFATVLEAAYESGVTIDRGLELAADASGTARARKAAALVASGKPVGEALPETGALPPALRVRIANAEMAGDLSAELRRIATEEFQAARTSLDRTVGIVSKGVYALLVVAVLFYALTILGNLPSL